ncbi:PAS domain S-box protein [Desulfobacterales bacterium HSG16]|nr:PAS domain S-box protein [Desulfobacterales bacterium HSG16]
MNRKDINDNGIKKAIIMAVDDRQDNLIVLKALITKFCPECRLTTAKNAKQGLSILSSTGVDVAILDFQMPGMDGIEMCRRIKTNGRTAHIPVLLVTAHSVTSRMKAVGLEAGADDFISKPIDNAEFTARIKVMLRIKKAEDIMRREKEILKEDVRKRTEKLEFTEKRYKTLFNNASDAIFIHDIDGRFLEVNNEACKRLGYTREEFSMMTPMDIDSPEYSCKVSENIEKLTQKTSAVLNTIHVAKNGKHIPSELNSRVINYDGIPAILTVARNITRRIGYETDLQRTNRALKVLYQCTDALRHAKDADELARRICRFIVETGQYIMAWVGIAEHDENKSVRPIAHFGYESEYLHELDITWADTVSGKNPAGKAIRTRKPHIARNIETDPNFTPWRKAGTLKSGFKSALAIPVFDSKKMYGALNIYSFESDVFDIKEVSVMEDLASNLAYGFAILEVRAEKKKVEKERALLAAAIEYTDEELIITDTTGVIVYVNPSFERTTGYKYKEAVGQNISILESGRHDKQYMENLWSTISSGKVWVGIFMNKKKDGTIYETETIISPVYDKNGKIINYVGVYRDMTERNMLEEKLRKAQKMEAIGTLAGGIAHDFNNILFPIVVYGDMAKDELPANSKSVSYINEIITAARRATDLVRQILAMSNSGSKEPRVFKIQTIVKEVLKFMGATLPSTISVTRNIDPKCGPIMGDPTEIHQILMNLCINAFHAMQEAGGKLEVIVKSVYLKPDDVVKEKRLKSCPYICISIEDTGCGMDSETKSRIFEPYFTTKEAGKGTGLGLSVSHGIVMKNKGDIKVESMPGKGTKFMVYFPMIKTSVAETEKNPDQKLPRGIEHVLVIDDEITVVKMLRAMLRSLGYKITGMTDSVKALNRFKEKPDEFDLVLTDMTMPAITGDILARKMIKIKPGLPVILCTGFNEMINEQKAKEAGIAKYIIKPIFKDDLAFTIRDILDKK